MNLRDLTEVDLDRTIWRYMPFSKFISLITYQALWFSKLKILEDEFEGKMPTQTRLAMNHDHQKYKTIFSEEYLHKQLDEMASKNEEDGRELIVANSWFFGENESERMWREYVCTHDKIPTTEGLAIKSTPRILLKNVFMLGDDHMGKVRYVDFKTHKMTRYEANQAIERAFLKDSTQFNHEQELRLATMFFKRPYCVRMDGKPYTTEEVEGVNMNNFENPGLYIGVRIDTLFTDIVMAPGAPKWLYNLVKRLMELYKIRVNISRSSLEQI
jgi:hypothetical protein